MYRSDVAARPNAHSRKVDSKPQATISCCTVRGTLRSRYFHLTIDLSRNRLKSTKPFAHLLALEELWLSGNSIQTFDDVESLSALGTRDGACLEGIYLEMNPVAGDFEYRKKLAQMIPSLRQIDANAIGGNHAIGVPTARMQGMVDRMRELQDAALRRASEQAEAGQEAAQPEPADAEG